MTDEEKEEAERKKPKHIPDVWDVLIAQMKLGIGMGNKPQPPDWMVQQKKHFTNQVRPKQSAWKTMKVR